MKHRLCLLIGLLVLASNTLRAQTLQDALDAPSLTWTTSGTGGSPATWIAQTNVSHDGISAAKTSLAGTSTSGQTVTLQTTVTGPGTLTFWWFGSYTPDDGSKLIFSVGATPMATNTTYPLWSQQIVYVNAGSQTLKWVFSDQSFGTSYPGYVDQVNWMPGSNAPQIIVQPVSQSVVPGLNATFSVTAGGEPPLTYHWQLNGTNLPGATNPSLTITNVQATNLGAYHVVISNKSTNTSADASLEFGELSVWGDNPAMDNRGTPPLGATNVQEISAGGGHNLLVKTDGTILDWGSTNSLAANPETISNILYGAALNSGSAVLNADGTVTAWGNSAITNVPPNVTNVVALAQSPTANFCMALKGDGTVVAWGNLSTVTNVPSTVTNIVSIAAGELHCLALKSDGTIVGWGDNSSGQRTIPAAQLYSTTNRVVAIAAGGLNSTALRSDGTVFCWGSNSSGQTNVPPTAKGGVIAIAAGFAHNLALRTNGTVVAWGRNLSGQTNVPVNLSNVVAIAAGSVHSMALVGNSPIAQAFAANPSINTNSFSFSIPSQNGRVFELEFKNSLTDTNWTANWAAAPLAAGNGTNLFLTDSAATNSQRFYRVRRW